MLFHLRQTKTRVFGSNEKSVSLNSTNYLERLLLAAETINSIVSRIQEKFEQKRRLDKNNPL